MGHSFFDGPVGWQKVVDSLNRSADRGDTAGIDSEFYGCSGWPEFDIRKMSCAGGRTRVHLWSVAVKRWPHVLSPRGFHVADAAVLLAPALDYTPLRNWLESDAKKVAHNAGVDLHSFGNHGVRVGGCRNSLALARWVWPERARGRGYGADALGADLLGAGKTESFRELFSEEVEEVVRVKQITKTVCNCGEGKCRKRKLPEHGKATSLESLPVIKRRSRQVSLTSVIPGHFLWERAVAYSARDPIIALGVLDLVERRMLGEVPWPW